MRTNNFSRFAGFRIWGLTAGILIQVCESELEPRILIQVGDIIRVQDLDTVCEFESNFGILL